VHISTNCQPGVDVWRVIPPIIVVVVSAWPVVATSIARFVVVAAIAGSARSTGPIGATIARAPRQAIIDVRATIVAATGPAIAAAARRSMVKAIVDVSATAEATATAATATATAATLCIAAIDA
jgi:hypothetical protein